MSGRREILGRYVDVGGVRTYYESAGEGDCILCIHSAGRDGRQWQAYLEHFSDRYRVAALDLPGHQKSWPMPGNRCIDTPEELAEFLWRFVDIVGLARPVLMGCSVGGDIVLRMAQMRPAQVRAIVAFDGADFTARGQSALLGHPQISLPDYTYDRSMCQVGRRTSPEIRSFIGWNIRQTAVEAQLADNNVFCTFDVRTGMDAITCPTLLIRGGDDWTVTQQAVADTASRLRRAAMVESIEIPGAGHWSHQEMPAEGCEAVERFLKKVEPRAA